MYEQFCVLDLAMLVGLRLVDHELLAGGNDLELGEGHSEHSVLEHGLRMLQIGVLGHLDLSLHGAVGALQRVHFVGSLLVHVLSLRLHDEHVVLNGQFQIVGVDAREVCEDLEFILSLNQVGGEQRRERSGEIIGGSGSSVKFVAKWIENLPVATKAIKHVSVRCKRHDYECLTLKRNLLFVCLSE